MRAMLDDPAIVKHVNHVRFLNRTQAVRDRDGRSPLRRRVEGRLHDLFGFAVERGRRFVEEENFRVAEESAGDGDALLLTAGEHAAFAADDGGEAVTVDLC